MKLAWICYMFENGDAKPIIMFEEPHPYQWHKVVPIVYAEIIE